MPSLGPCSELVFHSLMGQLCLSVPCGVEDLRSRVTGALKSLSEWIPPERVAGLLFGRLALSGDERWTPQLSQILSGAPGVRVSTHSHTEYVVSAVPGGESGWFESIEIPSPGSTRKSAGWGKNESEDTATEVLVFQTMLGTMYFSLPSGVRDIRAIVVDGVSSPNNHPSFLAGSIVRRLGAGVAGDVRLSVDLSSPQLNDNTFWLRHLSGGTYVYAEGMNPQAEQWKVVGKGFLDSRFERELLGDYSWRVSSLPVSETGARPGSRSARA